MGTAHLDSSCAALSGPENSWKHSQCLKTPQKYKSMEAEKNKTESSSALTALASLSWIFYTKFSKPCECAGLNVVPTPSKLMCPKQRTLEEKELPASPQSAWMGRCPCSCVPGKIPHAQFPNWQGIFYLG